ncbi:MAG TPA: tetratricopeptide repeat protein, partial [Candidatus Acidoferrales bacterium]|nr:tetratricopeptide repeat protein [Candidatus Acidoferrales bacterium]
RETAEIRALLQESRLVTMTGAGGIGKTRLALEVAGLVSDSHPDGTWLVELAGVTVPDLVTQAVAAALGVAEEKGTSLLETLSRHLQERTLLLVLDNCEHLVEASSELAAALLKRSPGLRLLATSRERLGVAGEQVWPAPGLRLDDAVRLFEMRARAARPGFSLAASARQDVEDVCRRLDGIPLAIELAAAHIRHLAPQQLLERLANRFRVDAGARAGGGRHQTLRATVEWSYLLLEPQEKDLFDRLSVFTGGFRLEDAEAVATGGEIEAGAVLDLLIRLVDKSLLVVDAGPDTARYRQLETLRQFGGERLAAAGLADAFGRRHADHFTELAETGEQRLRGAEQEAALGELSLALDNVGAALVWSRRHDPDVALRLAAAMVFFWIIRSRFSEARAWVQEMLEATEPDSPNRVRGLGALGRVAHHQGDLPAARLAYSEAIQLSRRRGEDSVAAGTLVNLANIAEEQGDYSGARAGFEESLAFFRAADNRYGVGVVTNNLGNLLFDQGDVGAARPLLEESLAVRRESGDLYGAATSLGNLAYVCLELGDLERARRLAEESLELRRRIEDRSGEAIAREALAEIELREGRLAEARGLLAEVLMVLRELEQRSKIAFTLETFAELLVRDGDGERALTLLGAAVALREATGAAVPAVYRPRLERIRREAGELAGEAAEEILAAGRQLDLDAAVDLALADTR